MRFGTGLTNLTGRSALTSRGGGGLRLLLLESEQFVIDDFLAHSPGTPLEGLEPLRGQAWTGVGGWDVADSGIDSDIPVGEHGVRAVHGSGNVTDIVRTSIAGAAESITGHARVGGLIQDANAGASFRVRVREGSWGRWEAWWVRSSPGFYTLQLRRWTPGSGSVVLASQTIGSYSGSTAFGWLRVSWHRDGFSAIAALSGNSVELEYQGTDFGDNAGHVRSFTYFTGSGSIKTVVRAVTVTGFKGTLVEGLPPGYKVRVGSSVFPGDNGIAEIGFGDVGMREGDLEVLDDSDELVTSVDGPVFEGRRYLLPALS